MKYYKLTAAVAAICLTAACEVKTSGGSGGNPIPNDPLNKPWPAYAEQPLTGKVFGKDWQALTAVVRPFGGDASKVSVQFHSVNSAEICKSTFTPMGTYASVVIPAAYSEQEIVSDLTSGEGNPLVFSTFEGGAQNVIADKTKIRISNLTTTGFLASVYASGPNEDGSTSEINGKITVTDCRKVADFSVWSELERWYDLQTFDGQTVRARYARVASDTRTFYDRSQKRYVRTMMFPLYGSVSDSFAMEYQFGPMEGLGISTVQDVGGVKTYKYSYSGPINMSGEDITLILDITAVKTASGVSVNYALEVVGRFKANHKFTMK